MNLLIVSHDASLTGAPIYINRLSGALKFENQLNISFFFSSGGPIQEELKLSGFQTFVSNKRINSKRIIPRLIQRIVHYAKYVYILHKTKPSVVYSNTITNCGEVVLSKVFGYAVVVHMHEGFEFASTIKYKLRIQNLFSDEFFCGSHYVKYILKMLCSRDGIYMPIGIPIKNRCTNKNLKTDPLVLGMLGTINDNKGQLFAINYVIDAIEKGRFVRLLIAGFVADKEYYNALRNLVHANNIHEYVDFLGPVDSADEFLSTLDVLLVCSRDEALPTNILEAMRARVVVLASNVGGISEIVKDNVTGFLFQYGNMISFSGAVDKIREQKDINPVLDAAFNNVCENYNIEIVASRLLNNLKHIA